MALKPGDFMWCPQQPNQSWLSTWTTQRQTGFDHPGQIWQYIHISACANCHLHFSVSSKDSVYQFDVKQISCFHHGHLCLWFTGFWITHVHTHARTHARTHTNTHLLLVTLKCDLAMVCLTTFGVTVLIFHFNSRLCSAGSSSTAEHTTQKPYVFYSYTNNKQSQFLIYLTTPAKRITAQKRVHHSWLASKELSRGGCKLCLRLSQVWASCSWVNALLLLLSVSVGGSGYKEGKLFLHEIAQLLFVKSTY